jgi:hypothetical protein
MSAHGVITEPSVSYHRVTHDRKGREGNRKGGEGKTCGDFPSIRPVSNARAGRPATSPSPRTSRVEWMGQNR